MKAAYRLFSQEEVTYERIMAPHWQHTRELCAPPGEYLLIEDTTVLDFTNRQKARGFGWVADEWSLGLFLHTTLALRVEAWDLQQSPEVNVIGPMRRCWWPSLGWVVFWLARAMAIPVGSQFGEAGSA